MTTISFHAPSTSYIAPSLAELRKLYAIVIQTYPKLKSEDSESQFARAFWSVGHQFRLAAPNKKLDPSFLLQEANLLLSRYGAEPVEMPAFFVAALASGDVRWRQADPSRGELFELALDPHSGRACENIWLRLLEGGCHLLPPVPPRDNQRRWSPTSPAPQVSILQLNMTSGQMEPLPSHAAMWGRR